MRHIFTLILACVCAMAVYADEPSAGIVTHINTQQGGIAVEIPSELENELQFKKEDPRQDKKSDNTKARRPTVGYRVEIFADNNARTAKSQAIARRRKVSARLPQYPSYLVFESPYWRVRVGDFVSRSEAQSAMSEIRRTFPAFSHDLRVVRSHIK